MKNDVLSLLANLHTKHYIALNKEAEAEFMRITGKPVAQVTQGFTGLVNAIGEIR